MSAAWDQKKVDHIIIIAELEMLAVWVGIEVFHDHRLNNDSVFFYNNAVLSSLILGRTCNNVMPVILQRFFEWEDANGMNIWYERVERHANIADGPSHGRFAELAGSQKVEVDLFSILNAMDHS